MVNSPSGGGPDPGSDAIPGYDAVGNFFKLATGASWYWNIATGVIYGGSSVGLKKIPDGLTKTYLLGEKALAASAVRSVDSEQSNSKLRRRPKHVSRLRLRFARWCYNSYPNAPSQPPPAGDRSWLPVQDRNDDDWNHWGIGQFGSPHTAACYFLMCDGSVQAISYNVDPVIHWKLGNRNDGQSVQLP